MKKKVAFYTLGCKVNQYETNAMEKLFSDEGYEIVPFDEAADVYVVNTCTVTSVGDKKSRQILRRAKHLNPDAVIAAVGCLAQTDPKQIENTGAVDVIVGTNNKNSIVEAVEAAKKTVGTVSRVTEYDGLSEFELMSIDRFDGRERAYIKIQEGCDRFCTYCIIPYARGKVRSAREEDIIKEAERLGNNGFSEIVLTGIHVASYGRGTENTLSGLIKKLSEIDSIKRIRLSSVDPVAFSDEFIKTAAVSDKLCPHFHISLQSGSDDILRRMNRRYTSAEYYETLCRIRESIENVSITTDVITGFPHETEEEFEKSYNFVEKCGFAAVHVFPYSERKGTPAAKFGGVVPKNIRNERAHKMSGLAAHLKKKFTEKYIGNVMPVLFESKHSDGTLSGFTANYIKVCAPAPDDAAGKILNVQITGFDGENAIGILAEKI